jgi:hypothetical protein
MGWGSKRRPRFCARVLASRAIRSCDWIVGASNWRVANGCVWLVSCRDRAARVKGKVGPSRLLLLAEHSTCRAPPPRVRVTRECAARSHPAHATHFSPPSTRLPERRDATHPRPKNPLGRAHGHSKQADEAKANAAAARQHERALRRPFGGAPPRRARPAEVGAARARGGVHGPAPGQQARCEWHRSALASFKPPASLSLSLSLFRRSRPPRPSPRCVPNPIAIREVARSGAPALAIARRGIGARAGARAARAPAAAPCRDARAPSAAAATQRGRLSAAAAAATGRRATAAFSPLLISSNGRPRRAPARTHAPCPLCPPPPQNPPNHKKTTKQQQQKNPTKKKTHTKNRQAPRRAS